MIYQPSTRTHKFLMNMVNLAYMYYMTIHSQYDLGFVNHQTVNHNYDIYLMFSEAEQNYR